MTESQLALDGNYDQVSCLKHVGTEGIDWYPAAEGGRIAAVDLGAETVIGPHRFFQGTTITFYADGAMQTAGAWPDDTLFKPAGRRPRAHGTMKLGDVTCSLEHLVRFEPDGRLSGCIFPRRSKEQPGEQRVNGLDIVHGFDTHSTGALRGAFVAREQVIGSIFVSGNVLFHDNGTLRETAVREQVVSGIIVQGGIRLHPNGQLAEATLTKAQRVDGYALPADAHVILSTTGELLELHVRRSPSTYERVSPENQNVPITP